MYKAIGLIFLLFLTSCSSVNISSNPANPVNYNQVLKSQVATTTVGETVYIPVYSYIFFENENNNLPLTGTLSIHNTDLNDSILINSVRYYDNDGNFLRNYLTQPISLKALASTHFVVPRRDVSGGLGANFIVEWAAQNPVSQPIIEAIMISTAGNHSVSFMTTGKVIRK